MPTIEAMLYPSTSFKEGAGAVLFRPSSNQVCLVRHKVGKHYFLPKGRRCVGENRHETAIRKVVEDTGYKCHLLPVNLESWQPAVNEHGGPAIAPVKHQGVCEPFIVRHMVKADRVLSTIWLYGATIDENAKKGKVETRYDSEIVDIDEAAAIMFFEPDREVVAKAVEIYKASSVVVRGT